MKCLERKSQKKSLMTSPSILPTLGRSKAKGLGICTTLSCLPRSLRYRKRRRNAWSTATAVVRMLSVLSTSCALSASACFLRSSSSPTRALPVPRLQGNFIVSSAQTKARKPAAFMKAVLAFDQGTTSSRAIAFGRDGRILASSQQEFRQIFPRPGWVEHDPLEIWATQRDVAAETLRKAALAPSDVAAIGLTNQRETTIVWERASGRPIANAIVWQDRRTASRCDVLRQAGHEPLFTAKTGLLLDAYFSGTKLAWLLDEVPGARTRAEKGELAFGTVDSWLAWQLSGGSIHVTDATNASRTLLFDIHTGDWDDELLALLKVPRP